VIAVRGLGIRLSEEWQFHELDMTVEPGECAAVIGPNGAGKSTLLRSLYGIQAPTRGTISVAGSEPDERDNTFRRKVSVVPDDSDCFAELNPIQHLGLVAGSFGEDLGDFGELLADAGLAERAHLTAGRFSAGQRRRLLLLGEDSASTRSAAARRAGARARHRRQAVADVAGGPFDGRRSRGRAGHAPSAVARHRGQRLGAF
jgi:ABC-2 type transport system ATP-binding protein